MNIFDQISANTISQTRNDTDGNDQEDDNEHSESRQEGFPSDAFQELSETITSSMLNGFELLKNSLDEFGSNLTKSINKKLEGCQEGSDDESDPGSEDEESENIFNSLSKENLGEKVGPEINQQLADLMNKLLSTGMKDKVATEKDEKYLKPQNVQFASYPKINAPIWEAMRVSTKKTDVKMQQVHKNILKAALPVANVMQEMYDNLERPNNLDLKKLITTLSDSLNFIGSANVQLVAARKDCIRNDLPNNMQGLCKFDDEISPDLLFGEDLNTKIKKVSELNKIKSKVSFSTRGGKNASFQRGGFRGSKMGNRNNRSQGRFHPAKKPSWVNNEIKNGAAKGGSAGAKN